MADEYDINENNFLARIGQIKETPKPKAAPTAEKEE
jgi:hypothetical protein